MTGPNSDHSAPAREPKTADVGVVDPKADSRAWPTVFPEPPGRPWVLIQTKPNGERTVLDALRERLPRARCDDVYVPIERIWRARRPHERPLIRGYVFASLADYEFALLHEVEGVSRLVTFRDRGEKVASFVVEVRGAEARGEFDKTTAGKRRVVGDRVRIANGPFQGFIGCVTRLNGKRRAQVMLAILGASVSVDIELKRIETAA